jgi:diacylglycerol kinase (ATP)
MPTDGGRAVAVIINPISGAGGNPEAAAGRARVAAEALRAKGLGGEVVVTSHPGQARDLAAGAVAHGVRLVVAWGGDGTINEVGGALVSRDAALGIVPAGSGNGLARELGLPLQPEAALATALAGAERRIDAGELNGRFFFNVAGLGFDARVARLFNTRAHGRRGLLPYVVLGLRALWSYEPAVYEVEADGATRRVRAFVLAFANSRQYGNGAVLAPGARFDDGLLDLVAVDPRPLPIQLLRARHLRAGAPPNARGIDIRRVRAAVVTSSEPLECHVDGEVFAPGRRAEVRVHAGALRVRTPGAS